MGGGPYSNVLMILIVFHISGVGQCSELNTKCGMMSDLRTSGKDRYL